MRQFQLQTNEQKLDGDKTAPKKLRKAVNRPCPNCYAPLSLELVCKLHGKIEECKKCKKLINRHGKCECKPRQDVVKTPQPRKPRPGTHSHGKRVYTPVERNCIVCGAKARRKYCDDHRSWLGMIRYWMEARNMTEAEAVIFVQRDSKEQMCVKCNRPKATLQRGTMLCRSCVVKSRTPKGTCVSCGGPTYSKGGYFCSDDPCRRLSIRTSYYKSTGLNMEQILEKLKPQFDNVKKGLPINDTRTDFTQVRGRKKRV